MVKQNKFKLSIPDPSDNTKELHYFFTSVRDVCQFLEISPNSLYSLATGRLKCVHSNKKRLTGIKVEKIPVYYSTKPDNNKIETEIKEFREKIIKSKQEKTE
jgi:hypothetical protein